MEPNEVVGYLIAIALVAAGIVRCRNWAKASSRPMTIAAFTLAASIACRLPQASIDHFLHGVFHLSNMTELVADLMVLVFSSAVCIHIVIAVDRSDLVYPIAFVSLALLFTSIVSYSLTREAYSVQSDVTIRVAPLDEALGVYQVVVGIATLSAFVFLLYGTLATRSETVAERMVVGCYMLASILGAVVGLFGVIVGAVVENSPRFYHLSWRIWLCMAAWLAAGLLINSLGRRSRPMRIEASLS